MNGLLRYGLVGGLLLLPFSVGVANGQSRLIGDAYSFSTTNFPGDLGETEDPVSRELIDHGTPPAVLTFDGVEEVAGGMRVNERVVSWPGTPGGIPAEQVSGIDGETEFDLLDWEFPGEVIEFSFQTVDGEWIADNPLGQSAYTIRDLQWRNSKPLSEPFFFETGFYFYFSTDGKPVTGYETALPELGLLVGEHPFDETIPEVVYIGYSRGQVNEVTVPYEGGFDVTGGTSQLDEENGSWAALADVMSLPQLASTMGKPANGFHFGMLVEPPEGLPVVGDVNLDGLLSVADFDEMARALREGLSDARYDLDGNGRVEPEDRRMLIEDVAKTWFGDANFDGVFNTTDFIEVFQKGEYEDGIAANSTWADGDWDGNADFDSGDFLLAFQAGGFEKGPRAAVASVPEPSAGLLLVFGLAFYAAACRKGLLRRQA